MITAQESLLREVFRSIPAVDLTLKSLLRLRPDLNNASQDLLVSLINNYWAEKRLQIRQTGKADPISLDQELPLISAFIDNYLSPNLRRVLNATGVVIHTNMGRSTLAAEAAEAAAMAGAGYTNLELDMTTGERGSRHTLTEELICRLTGAEAACVVNNNAAAVLLLLDTLCSDGEAIVSRGELVEIGGSFRIPDIMAKSGTILREIGTTNRTHLHDYENAINQNTKAILRVHTSNFRVIGFHKEVATKELKQLGDKHSLPVIFDLGSGSLLDFSKYGLPQEPTVSQALAEGADCVSFSGDKALGGPQAGIIAGKAAYVNRCKKNPLMRALRCDKLCLAALEATLRLYLDPEKALAKIPTPRMLSKSPNLLAKEARSLAAKIRRSLAEKNIACAIAYKKDVSRAGGGTFPESNLHTTLVCLRPASISAQDLRDRLLQATPPLLGRMDQDYFCLDPRTLAKNEYALAVNSLIWALSPNQAVS